MIDNSTKFKIIMIIIIILNVYGITYLSIPKK